MPLTPGQVISGYRVVGPLGAGGMGEVYRARDSRLERDVAIKVLPEGWDAEPAHVMRFEREARLLASLSHANVAHVYGFDELDGTRFLVLELVEGEDLAMRIGRGPLAVEEALDLCRQVAEGLEAAHEIGVVHRDLKPGNVRVTPNGVAKVLDFGLAKVVRGDQPHEGSDGTFQTEAGLLVGTPTYMSPESFGRGPVDRRADIWAFGCVLYECLVGQPPFVGESLPDAMASIARAEPDLTLLPRGTPPDVRRLISRCLEKNPRARLRDIGEARIVLEGAREIAPAPPEGGARRRGAVPLVATAAILAATAGAFLLSGPAGRPAAPRSPLEGASITRITDFEGMEFDATISRDGKFVAFVSDRDGELHAWLGQVGGGEFRRFTQERRRSWWTEVRNISFDRDSTHLLFCGGTGLRRRAFPVLGGDPQDAYAPNSVHIDWSPDGSRCVYQTDDDGDPLFVADPDGANPVQIRIDRPGLHQHFPTWSFDGEWILVVRGFPATEEMDLWRLRPDGTGLERLTSGLRNVGHPTPVDARTVLFVARENNGEGPWMWALDLENLASVRVSMGVEQYLSIAATEDGRKLVATVANPRAHLYAVPILDDREATEADVRPLEGLESVRALMPRYCGESLFFLSSRGTGDGLFRLKDGRTEQILSGAEHALLLPAAGSLDGTSVAVALREAGRLRLNVLRADGTSRRALTGDVDVRGAPAWSPDGRWIAVGGSDPNGRGLFKVPVDGGPPVRLALGDALNPVWSPTEDLIVYEAEQLMGLVAVRGVRASDGRPAEIPLIHVVGRGERCRFLPDGRGLVYMQGVPEMQGTQGMQDFWLLDIETGNKRRLTRLEDTSRKRTFDIDPTGTRIVFDREEMNSDIVMIDLPPRATDE